jgi:deoxyribodipyrimidine photo-lyase
MSKGRVVIWFSTDLRLEDNATLSEAVRLFDEVIPVYCVDDRLFAQSQFGFFKMGIHRSRFLWESLKDLDKNLRLKGSGLLLEFGRPEEVLPRVVQQFKARAVFAKKEVAHDERLIQASVQRALLPLGCSLDTWSTSTLYLATDLPFPLRSIPEVFTDFRKKVERECEVRDSLQAPDTIFSPDIPEANWSKWPDSSALNFAKDPRSAFPFNGGETEVLKRLEYYLFGTDLIAQYKQTRNGLVGADYSSKFSPWLALGCISPKKIFHEVKRYEQTRGANDSTYWLVFELLWRDYFRFMMKKHGVKYFQLDGLSKPGSYTHQHQNKKLLNWINGSTGVDFIDANMIELKSTGFMSNRGRQNVASYFCHDLKGDWRFGAAYFEEMLIDYDPCSNWANWAYIAGIGNDPRKDRYFNIAKQSEAYDPRAEYRKLWME